MTVSGGTEANGEKNAIASHFNHSLSVIINNFKWKEETYEAT